MSEDSKSFERKLDLDFLYYLSLTKNLYGNISDAAHKQFCEIWLAYLFGKTCNTLAEKCDRNVYLSRLLLQMQSGKLNTNFLEPPPNGPLPCAFTTFGLPTEVDGLKGFQDMGYQVDSTTGIGSGDFTESSRDGRTYLATRHLPQGIMAFLAVTNNEGEPAWVPQTCPANLGPGGGTKESGLRLCEKRADRYTRILMEFIEVPLCTIRKSPEERERVLEWMDKIINDCSKWLQGEDPHNMELEHLFETLFEEYKKDPENSELLKHPRTVRNILFRDIRNKISERRAEVSRRELILDQYESEQFVEQRTFTPYLTKIWMKYAARPMSPAVAASLKSNYPPEVIERFSELLLQERMTIIQEGEKRAEKKINLLRKTIIEDSKQELQKLKRAQDEYKEYYSIYKDIERQLQELEKEYKEICSTSDQMDPQAAEKCKQDRELEIQQAKRNFDKEVKAMFDLRGKLDDMRANCEKANAKFLEETEVLNCKWDQMNAKLLEMHQQICNLKKKREELRVKLQERFGG